LGLGSSSLDISHELGGMRIKSSSTAELMNSEESLSFTELVTKTPRRKHLR